MMLILQDAMRTLLLTSLCLTVTIPAFAQYSDEIHHNNISVGGGAAIPVGSTSGYLNTAFAFSVSYGYRVNRFFQADAGFQMAFGAANNQNLEQTDFGEVQGGDHEFMLPLGGRFIIPLPFRKLEASAGGGGVYLHYAETAPSGGMRGIQATATRVRHEAAWGGYGLANLSYFLDRNRTFHVGTTLEFIGGSTNGQAVADIPSMKTTDHWTNVFIEFGISF